MELKHDRPIQISVGTNRKDIHWRQQSCTIAELWDRLCTPVRGVETLTEYLALTKARQDELKDVGGFVGGSLAGERRKAAAVTGRDLITLDLDTIPPYGTDDLIRSITARGFAVAIYSTRKHRPERPRLRVIFPLDRTVTADEYEPIARRMAETWMTMIDSTTFEACRMMYWPSCCSDADYVWSYQDAPLLSADTVLASYADWYDIQSWPQVPGVAGKYQKLAAKQGDPLTKPGIVGAFCRAYGNVYTVMDDLLPGIYAPCDNAPDRYTYTGGSTTGGAIVYDHGKFLFSHHGTDPCSGQLVNAFDLVRLHKFADMDDDATPGTPVNRLPSYSAMCKFAAADPVCATLMTKERRDQAVADFVDVVTPTPPEQAEPEEGDEWLSLLEINERTGVPRSTMDNVRVILEHDPLLRGRFALNQFAGRGEVLASLPWNAEGRRRMWSDTDNNGLYWYLEKVYNITGREKIDAALDVHASTRAFNDVQAYLTGLTWDGTPRLDTLFIDYLGAEDTEYTRAVTRKSFAAAVARAMQPGCKFDNMLILCGAQGIGKSTILDRMSRGWFNDSIRTFEGKEASELLQGVWLVEIAELDAFRKTDVSRIKQFLSLRVDRYRAAYGRNVKELPRCCVFFGTCNQVDFLQDTTGNRRFWPVDVGEIPHSRTVWEHLTPDEVDQVWAEARLRWQLGEPLYLSGAVEEAARQKQEQHRETDPREGLIQEFVARQVPHDWSTWPIDRRRDYWALQAEGEYRLVDREKICALEIWCELFGGSRGNLRRQDTKEINAVLTRIPGWKPRVVNSGPYPSQRGFVRV